MPRKSKERPRYVRERRERWNHRLTRNMGVPSPRSPPRVNRHVTGPDEDWSDSFRVRLQGAGVQGHVISLRDFLISSSQTQNWAVIHAGGRTSTGSNPFQGGGRSQAIVRPESASIEFPPGTEDCETGVTIPEHPPHE